MALEDLDISKAELKHLRKLVKGFKRDGFNSDEAIKRAIESMLRDSETEVASIEKQMKGVP